MTECRFPLVTDLLGPRLLLGRQDLADRRVDLGPTNRGVAREPSPLGPQRPEPILVHGAGDVSGAALNRQGRRRP